MENQSKVILYGMWASPYAKRVELALELKTIPYKYVEEDLRNKSDLLLKYNPVYKKIPVLVHNEKAIVESLVILEYIDETWNDDPKLLPDEPYKRAQVRFWSQFIDEKLVETTFLVFKTEGEAQQKAVDEVYEKLSVLENGMKNFFTDGNPCVSEKNAGILDILFCILYGGYKVHEEVLGIKFIVPEKFPVLFSWLMSIGELEAVKKVTPPHEKSVGILKLYRQSALKSSSEA